MVRNACILAAALSLAACSPASESPPAATDGPSEAPVPMAAAEPTPVPAPKPSPAPQVPARFRATGTEPFWGAKVDGGALTYSTPEFPDGTVVEVTRKQAGDSVIFSGTLDGKPLELAISAGPCSDGMSDRVYDWTATRTIGPDVQRGCAASD